jgi:FAD-binding domain/Ferric reductase NAD binding domain
MPICVKEFLQGFPTSLEVLPGDMTRVVIQCPQQLQWSPGQHCYISVPGISKLQSHPFTIVSLSQHWSVPGPNDMVILMRACKGFTKMVSELAIKSTPRSLSISSSRSWSDLSLEEPEEITISTRAWIDGPYGDFHPALELQFHGVFCIAGGSGITASLPWLVYLAAKMRQGANGRKGLRGEKLCKTRTLHLIWSIRNLSWIRWAQRELSEALRNVMVANALPPRSPLSPEWEKAPDVATFRPNYKMKISIYVTQEVEDIEMKAAMLDLYLGAGVDVYNPHAKVQVLRGRPSYSTILPNLIDRKRNIFLGKPNVMVARL